MPRLARALGATLLLLTLALAAAPAAFAADEPVGGGTPGDPGELPPVDPGEPTDPAPEPIAGVVYDGILHITIRDEAGDPVPFSGVSVVAYALDGEWGLAKDYVIADENGLVMIDGLPRPDADGPAIEWQVFASSVTVETIDGCEWVREWSGFATLAAAPGETSLDLATTASGGWGACGAPGADAPVLHGIVVGPDGLPVAIAEGYVFQARPEGGTYFAILSVGPDGTFAVAIHAWGSSEAPSTLTLSVRGEITRSETSGDCTTDYGLFGEATIDLALADGSVPADVTVTMVEGIVQVACAAEGGDRDETGDGSGGGPGSDPTAGNEAGDSGGIPTMPPTDMLGDAGGTAAPILPIGLGLLAMAIVTSVVALPLGRASRPRGR